MKNEQKKEYTKPQLLVVELECESSLLQCSGCDDDNMDAEFHKP